MCAGDACQVRVVSDPTLSSTVVLCEQSYPHGTRGENHESRKADTTGIPSSYSAPPVRRLETALVAHSLPPSGMQSPEVVGWWDDLLTWKLSKASAR